MKRTKLTQKVVISENSGNLQTYKINCENDLLPEQQEYVIECPDCFDTMIKIYDSDKVRYECENCDLINGGNWL